MYEVMDEIYDEYLEKTAETRPAEDESFDKLQILEQADEQK